MANTPNKIIVHHSAAAKPTPQFEAINKWHKERGFLISSLGYYVGYHYVIEKDGTVRKAKEEHEEGCHTIGQNLSSIGVCLAGNFDIEAPTKEQVAALGPLLSGLCTRYDIVAWQILPHRRFTNKSCYGSKLKDQWAALAYLDYEINRLEILRSALAT